MNFDVLCIPETVSNIILILYPMNKNIGNFSLCLAGAFVYFILPSRYSYVLYIVYLTELRVRLFELII